MPYSGVMPKGEGGCNTYEIISPSDSNLCPIFQSSQWTKISSIVHILISAIYQYYSVLEFVKLCRKSVRGKKQKKTWENKKKLKH